MEYLKREPERRSRPAELLPGAKSVISLALTYASPRLRGPLPPGEGRNLRPEGDLQLPHSLVALRSRGHKREGGASPYEAKPEEGKISRYAFGKDYHKVIGKKLESFVRYLEALSPGIRCKTFVDTGPLLERAFAQKSGLGFIGKNTMLITKGLGSWVFLASVITTLDLPIDAPDERSCGECRLCIDACPTEAITAPFELDARRCIAYLTIEQDGPIPNDLASNMQGWVFGCDICQEVCPHNSASPRLRGPLPPGEGKNLLPEGEDGASSDEAKQFLLVDLLAIRSDKDFQKRFAGTAITRAGRAGLVRNACVAAANLKRRDLIPLLEELSRRDSHDVVRKQAAWALERLGSPAGEPYNSTLPG